MRRRTLLALVGSALVAMPISLHAQSGRRVVRLGLLPSGEPGDPQSDAQVAALLTSLEALGWKQGRDLQVDLRRHGGDAARAAVVARELVEAAPDVIWASGTVGLTALHKATRTIPIVFVNVTDPVAGGFVESLPYPGGNITGITPFEYEIGGKWLESLREMAPATQRATLLGEAANHNFRGFQRSFEAYARSIGVEATSVDVRSAADVERAIRGAGAGPNGGLIVSASTFSIVHRKLILDLAAETRVPAIYWNRSYVAAGGLMSYGPDITDLSRQSAGYLDRILKGAKPGDLAVETPVKFQLIVNARAAKALGLDIPPLLLADDVIE